MTNIITNLEEQLFKIDRLSDGISIKTRIPETFCAFKGHFPESPILPGVVSGNLIVFLLTKYYKRKIKVKKIIKSNFKAPIIPNEEILIKINIKNSNSNESCIVSAKIYDSNNKEKLQHKLEVIGIPLSNINNLIDEHNV